MKEKFIPLKPRTSADNNPAYNSRYFPPPPKKEKDVYVPPQNKRVALVTRSTLLEIVWG